MCKQASEMLFQLGFGGKGAFSVRVSKLVQDKGTFRSRTYHRALLHPACVLSHLGSAVLSLAGSQEP